MAGQRGFFDLDERYAALSKSGVPLERLAGLVDFEMFRGELDAALARSDRTRGGRPPTDPVLMFKVLVLQALYGLSDAQAEFQIMDRRTFGRFLGLDDGHRVPDATAIWRFPRPWSGPARSSGCLPGSTGSSTSSIYLSTPQA